MVFEEKRDLNFPLSEPEECLMVQKVDLETRRGQEKCIIFPRPLFDKESEYDLKSHLKVFFEKNVIYEKKKAQKAVKCQ